MLSWLRSHLTNYKKLCKTTRRHSAPDGIYSLKRTDVLPQDVASGHWVSEPRDLGLNFSNRSEIWQAPRQQRHRDACQMLAGSNTVGAIRRRLVKCQSDMIIITANLAASKFHEIWR